MRKTRWLGKCSLKRVRVRTTEMNALDSSNTCAICREKKKVCRYHHQKIALLLERGSFEPGGFCRAEHYYWLALLLFPLRGKKHEIWKVDQSRLPNGLGS